MENHSATCKPMVLKLGPNTRTPLPLLQEICGATHDTRLEEVHANASTTHRLSNLRRHGAAGAQNQGFDRAQLGLRSRTTGIGKAARRSPTCALPSPLSTLLLLALLDYAIRETSKWWDGNGKMRRSTRARQAATRPANRRSLGCFAHLSSGWRYAQRGHQKYPKPRNTISLLADAVARLCAASAETSPRHRRVPAGRRKRAVHAGVSARHTRAETAFQGGRSPRRLGSTAGRDGFPADACRHRDGRSCGKQDAAESRPPGPRLDVAATRVRRATVALERAQGAVEAAAACHTEAEAEPAAARTAMAKAAASVTAHSTEAGGSPALDLIKDLRRAVLRNRETQAAFTVIEAAARTPSASRSPRREQEAGGQVSGRWSRYGSGERQPPLFDGGLAARPAGRGRGRRGARDPSPTTAPAISIQEMHMIFCSRARAAPCGIRSGGSGGGARCRKEHRAEVPATSTQFAEARIAERPAQEEPAAGFLFAGLPFAGVKVGKASSPRPRAAEADP